ncbi:GTPase HflX [Oleiphilus messinensis]|uniref:GTPase HflX n=1 Tax=Oleiphilus messinensis TaxID=141451 RepID=A0A1Y0I5Z0_9GAMM|nr:ribosome rescue GTPase HflX [Oleiphilus messinensis]ARU55908.1 GTPase HflX [Oleiphilus messinensis]
MFDRPDSGERAVLVHLDFHRDSEKEDPQEFKELVVSAGVEPVDFVTGVRDQPSPRYFIGTGKLDELKSVVEAHEAELVLFNHSLSPSQERNLEKELKCRVIDRTGLILDIFAQRARTHEGKLQVELAQLEHLSTRLIRGWTHLERQKGGIGLRGPGETQLETDRRLLRARIKAINARLERVRKQREQGRRSRKRAEIPSVSLVGYTNAGKSTLFNKITDAAVYAADQLFATLDPTLRRIEMDNVGPAVLADTVGFIRHLPHKLVDAFRATLEETVNADLLLHVIDCADEDRFDNIEQVESVLSEIGAADIPTLKVYNKTDLLESPQCRIDRDEDGVPERVWVSAVTGQGVDLLFQAMGELLGAEYFENILALTPAQGRLRARLFELNAVRREHYDDQGNCNLDVKLQRRDWNQLLRQLEISEDQLSMVGPVVHDRV